MSLTIFNKESNLIFLIVQINDVFDNNKKSSKIEDLSRDTKGSVSLFSFLKKFI